MNRRQFLASLVAAVPTSYFIFGSGIWVPKTEILWDDGFTLINPLDLFCDYIPHQDRIDMRSLYPPVIAKNNLFELGAKKRSKKRVQYRKEHGCWGKYCDEDGKVWEVMS